MVDGDGVRSERGAHMRCQVAELLWPSGLVVEDLDLAGLVEKRHDGEGREVVLVPSNPLVDATRSEHLRANRRLCLVIGRSPGRMTIRK